MTKKDYELFANALNVSGHTKEELEAMTFTYQDVVDLCSRVFQRDNHAFQPDKFERACYEGKHIRKSISGRV